MATLFSLVGRPTLFLPLFSKDMCYISCVSDNPGQSLISRVFTPSRVFCHGWQHLLFSSLWDPAISLGTIHFSNSVSCPDLILEVFFVSWALLHHGVGAQGCNCHISIFKKPNGNKPSPRSMGSLGIRQRGSQSPSQWLSVMQCRASETSRLHGGGSKEWEGQSSQCCLYRLSERLILRADHWAHVPES